LLICRLAIADSLGIGDWAIADFIRGLQIACPPSPPALFSHPWREITRAFANLRIKSQISNLHSSINLHSTVDESAM
jgi:hypothetical protein